MLEQLSNKIYHTSVYEETTKETKHSPVEAGEELIEKLMKLNKEDIEPYVLENWEVNEQEEIKRIETSEDHDEEAGVSS